jgi:hypothetical protein
MMAPAGNLPVVSARSAAPDGAELGPEPNSGPSGGDAAPVTPSPSPPAQVLPVIPHSEAAGAGRRGISFYFGVRRGGRATSRGSW